MKGLEEPGHCVYGIEINSAKDMYDYLVSVLKMKTPDGILTHGDFYHKFCLDSETKRLKDIDDTYTLRIMYVCTCLKSILSHSYLPLADVIDGKFSEDTRNYIDAWKIINSDVMHAYRANLIASLSKLISELSENHYIGDMSNVESELDGAISDLPGGLDSVKFEVYLKSDSRVSSDLKISPSVHVCDSLAECLLKLESSCDGVYTCFIRVPGTIDGWFGYFVKSNGNMFSYNDRIDEVYGGQHGRLRNGRYAERKGFDVFPYDLCNFSDETDYKGYSKSFDIQSEDLKLFHGEFSSFVRSVLMIAIILGKHRNKKLRGDTVCVDSLLTKNLPSSDENAIVKWGESSLVKTVNTFTVPEYDIGKFLAGEYNSKYDSLNGYGYFKGVNQNMVDVYGDGFEIDYSKLLKSDSGQMLIGDRGSQELVGCHDRFEQLCYYEARKQLADYIKDKLQKDFEAVGGHEGISKWYHEQLMNRIPLIVEKCRECYNACIGTYEDGKDWVDLLEQSRATVYMSNKSYFGWKVLNQYVDGKYKCPVSGSTASLFFKFVFTDAESVEWVLGLDLPRYCKFWKENPDYNGNCLLNMTDPVGEIEAGVHGHFVFAIGLSKRALTKKLEKFNI